MAAGCCCVASDIGAHRDLIAHGETGLLHPPGDADALASRISECLRNPDMRRKLGERARQAVAGRTWEAVSGEVVNFVENVIAGRPRRSAP